MIINRSQRDGVKRKEKKRNKQNEKEEGVSTLDEELQMNGYWWSEGASPSAMCRR